jgi:hypothetical protein
MKTKKVSISSYLDAPAEKVWEKIQDVATLVEICKPLARFKPVSGKMPLHWKEKATLSFKFYAYGMIPFGKHDIFLERVDPLALEIQSREKNSIVKVWDHLIRIEPVSENRVKYTDEIVVYAGIFTWFVARWSVMFYRHRQRKWSKIARKL